MGIPGQTLGVAAKLAQRSTLRANSLAMCEPGRLVYK